MTPTPTEVADVLDRAADVLDEHGWCGGTYLNTTTGEMCAEGAICEAMGLPLVPQTFQAPEPWAVMTAMRDHLQPEVWPGRDAELLFTLNDSAWASRFRDDPHWMSDQFRRCAKNLRNEATT